MCNIPWGTQVCSVMRRYDQCSSDPCLNGGTCTDMVNGFNCACHTRLYRSVAPSLDYMSLVSPIRTLVH